MKRLIAQYEGESLRARGDGFYTLLRSVVGQQISVKAADAVWARLEKAVQPLTPQKLLTMTEEELRACGLSRSKVAYARNVAEFFESRRLVPNAEAGDASPKGEATRLNKRSEFSRSGEGSSNAAYNFTAPSSLPSPARGEGAIASASRGYVNESEYWGHLSDDEIIAELVSIKGIGSWTAEMFLIFHLMRPDVFPVKDLGVLKAMHEHLPGIAPREGKAWLKPAEYEQIARVWAPYRTVATWYLWRALDPVPVEY